MVFINVGIQCAAWAWNGALSPVFLSLLHVRFYLNFGKLFSCFFVKSFPKKIFGFFFFALTDMLIFASVKSGRSLRAMVIRIFRTKGMSL